MFELVRKPDLMLNILAAALLLFFSTVQLSAQNTPVLQVASQEFETFGKRVSKSSVVRLATITRNRVRMSDSRLYDGSFQGRRIPSRGGGRPERTTRRLILKPGSTTR